MLSEDDIKRKFLPFLKEFYKYRYEFRPESMHTELDNVSAGGLVADGMVSFRKDDGSAFVCTYEATSVDKSEEVKFALNVRYFTWDCLAFGAVTALSSYVVAYALRFAWLRNLQWTGNLGFVLGMGIIGFFAWYFLLRKWRKYRYIYAIEQFKQYFAHEQWIALGADVFPAPSDPYLLELKSQCVYNGFGLALVPEEGETRVLVTPSRLGIYGKDRRMVHWVTRLEWYQAMSHNVGTLARLRPTMPDVLTQAWNQLTRPVRYLLIDPIRKGFWAAFSKPLGRTTSVFDRFMQAHSVQKWIFVLSLAAIVPMAYKVLTIREDKIDDIVERPKDNPEDQYGYLYEGESVRKRDPRGIPKQDPVPASQGADADVPTINLSGNSGNDAVQTINLSGDDEATPAPAEKKPKVYVLDEDTTVLKTGNPCSKFRKQKGWIIQDNAYTRETFAAERAASLRRIGLSADVIPMECLGEAANSGFAVRIGQTQPTEAAAVKEAGNVSKALERYGMLLDKPLARRLN